MDCNTHPSSVKIIRKYNYPKFTKRPDELLPSGRYDDLRRRELPQNSL
jgi:hypothetical protein